MFTLIIPALLVAVTILFMTVVAAIVATRQDVLQPATVDPFFGTAQGTSSEDTISANQEMVQTVLSPKTDWQSKNFRSLSQVEDMLDMLEAHGVEEREVIILTEDCFTVRWK